MTCIDMCSIRYEKIQVEGIINNDEGDLTGWRCKIQSFSVKFLLEWSVDSSLAVCSDTASDLPLSRRQRWRLSLRLSESQLMLKELWVQTDVDPCGSRMTSWLHCI